jgi:integrase
MAMGLGAAKPRLVARSGSAAPRACDFARRGAAGGRVSSFVRHRLSVRRRKRHKSDMFAWPFLMLNSSRPGARRRCSAHTAAAYRSLPWRPTGSLMAKVKDNRWGHRDATMILVAYRHGLRVSELVDLRWEQVDFRTAALHVRRVKKGTPQCAGQRWYLNGGFSVIEAQYAQKAACIHDLRPSS